MGLITSLFPKDEVADLDLGADHLLLVDEAGTVVIQSAGSAVLALFGFVDADPAGCPLDQLIAGASGVLAQNAVKEAFESGQAQRFRFLLDSGSSQRWFLLAVEPVIPLAGSPPRKRVRGVLLDVTRMTLCEAAHELMEDQDRTVTHGLDFMPEPVLVCDIKHEGIPVIYANRAFSSALGYRIHEVLGRNPFALLFGDQANEAVAVVEQASAGSGTPWRIFRCQTREGNQVPCHVVFHFSAESEAFSLLRMTFLMEHAHSRDWQQELTADEYARMEIQVLLSAAGGLINDFNNLLTGIQQREQYLSGSGLDVHQYLEGSRAYAAHAANLVFELLRTSSYAKVAGREPFRAPATVGTYAESPAIPATVLVVDDEAAVREVIREQLAGSGYRAVAVSSGNEALRAMGLAGAQPVAKFDLLITDLLLSDMSGLSLVQTIRGMGISLPILMISGYFSHESKETAGSLRDVLLLEKPFRSRDLHGALAHLLGAN